MMMWFPLEGFCPALVLSLEALPWGARHSQHWSLLVEGVSEEGKSTYD